MTSTTWRSVVAATCGLVLVGCEGLPTQLADEAEIDQMVFSGNYRINADDEFVVQRDRERIECRV